MPVYSYEYRGPVIKKKARKEKKEKKEKEKAEVDESTDANVDQEQEKFEMLDSPEQDA